MCQINSKPFKVSEEEITCYKVVFHWDYNVYATPYMASLYRVGTRYKDSGDSNVVYRNGMMEVHGGCYHFVKDLEGARKLAEFLTKIRFRYNRVFVVAKCTIPAGTMVSEGMFRTNNGTVVVDSICAKSFEFVEIVDEDFHIS